MDEHILKNVIDSERSDESNDFTNANETTIFIYFILFVLRSHNNDVYIIYKISFAISVSIVFFFY